MRITRLAKNRFRRAGKARTHENTSDFDASVMMNKATPVIYVLHGDNEFAIKQVLSSLEAKVGDDASAALNITYLDERNFSPGELLSVASAMPFLAKRRLVVVFKPTSQLKSPTERNRFLEQLELIPPTTALVLVEDRILTSARERKKKKIHWLEKWALEAGERVYIKAYNLPKGQDMVGWILDKAQKEGGSLTRQAANLLNELVGEDPRLADQEIKKLLAYVNYQRPVDYDDVELLTADVKQGDVFKFVDMLGSRNGCGAMGMLKRLLERQEAILLYGLVIRQFRLLLLTCEVLDHGGRKGDVIRHVKVHPFVADKLISQVKYFSLEALESIYRRLLDIDESIKIGELSWDLALETLVVALSESKGG